MEVFMGILKGGKGKKKILYRLETIKYVKPLYVCIEKHLPYTKNK